ncbi:D-alanyl-D-alanine carboxypeptidase [Streptomyces triticirhizae]|uniref:D-alanyl-D-alanine carboxypeptidase n=1 Tax=Streptomyces triticirhizae TaxID=2483353 RepID=UPI0022792299|nr:D-alanyl-D-alanine carboxypeptidase [Streptomyces triticirhizae]
MPGADDGPSGEGESATDGAKPAADEEADRASGEASEAGADDVPDEATRMLRLPASDRAAAAAEEDEGASDAEDHLTTELRVPADAGDRGTTALRSLASDQDEKDRVGADRDGTDQEREKVSASGGAAGEEPSEPEGGRAATDASSSGEGQGDGDGAEDGESGGDATTMLRLPASEDEADDHATRMLRLPPAEKETGDRLTTQLRVPSEGSGVDVDGPEEAEDADAPEDEDGESDGESGTRSDSDATAMLRLPASEERAERGGSPDVTATLPVGEEETPTGPEAPVKGGEAAKSTETNTPEAPARPTEPPEPARSAESTEPARPADEPEDSDGPQDSEGEEDSGSEKDSEGEKGSSSGAREADEAVAESPAPAVPPKPAASPPRPAGDPPKPEAAPAPALPPKPEAAPPPADADRDPLELLAALTNKPAPPPTPLRTLARRVKIWTPLAVLLLIVFVVAQMLRPLPEPGLELTAAETYTFEGELAGVPWPEQGQAQLDVQGLGSFGSSGEQEPVPIASVAKVMTAYVILRDHPMDPETDGAVIPVDQQAEDDAGLSADGESTVDVEAGTDMTQREAIQAIMIASANNVARLLARWDAGSEEEFVEKMNEAAAELGMTDTVYTDPSGLREETVSTAADQVKLAKEVMKDPFFREIVRMPSYEDSRGRLHYNYNQLVPMDGVIGIKPGTTTVAGGNLMFAAEQQVGDTTQLIVGAVLAQPPHPSDNSILTGALTAGRELMRFAQGELVAEPLLSAGDVVGEVDDGLGGRVPLVVTEDLPVVGWPGLEVRLELEENADGVPGSAEAGTEVGTLRVGEGDGSVEVPVALGEDLAEPGFGARLTRIT